MQTNNKLRKALTKILNLTNSLDEDCAVDPVEIRDIAKDALDEPVKNYEVGTAQEQTARFAEFCKSHIHSDLPKCAGCPLEDIPFGTRCAQAWAQMPYESEVVK